MKAYAEQPNKLKHLEFIQNIIERQAKNSFLLKGWTITVVAAVFTFVPKSDPIIQILSVYSLIFIYWMLDSYYLWQERLFRALYNHVRVLEENEIDFNMDVKRFSKQINCSWWDIALSRTLLIFYISLMVFTLIFFSWK